MKISIITVCYNSGKTIEDTFKSVQSQSYKDIEYIVIDGGSKDNTLELINQYKEIIDYSVSEKDNGLYDAMNKGIEKATGDVIGFLNSDDLFCDDMAVEKVMNVFNENSKIDSVYADIYYVDQNNTDKIVRQWITGKQKTFKKGWHPAHPGERGGRKRRIQLDQEHQPRRSAGGAAHSAPAHGYRAAERGRVRVDPGRRPGVGAQRAGAGSGSTGADQ